MGSALPHLGLPSRADYYAAALEGLVQTNDLVMADDPSLPPLYESGALYQPRQHRDWRRADMIVREGWGDCEGLSAWRAAELRRGVNGYDPYARVGVYHTGPRKYHAIVLRGDDTIEDPSIPLGLRWRPEMPTCREEMNELNGMWVQEWCPASIDIVGADVAPVGEDFSTEIVKHPNGGVAAQVKVPLADGSGNLVATSSPSDNEAIAAAKAANMILGLGKKIATDPTLAARLLPEAVVQLVFLQQPTIKAAIEKAAKTAYDAGQKLAKGAGGAVESVIRNAAGAVGTLVSALKFW